MIKQSITQLFDQYQSNKITNVPFIQFRPNRDIFQYLIAQRIIYKDLRKLLIPSHSSQNNTQTFTQTLQRYANQFQFRKSSFYRFITHSLQYTTMYSLIIFGFYSRQFSGWKRFNYVLKQTAKTALYSTGIFGTNQLIYPFYYKFSYENKQKQMFTIGNLISSLIIWPIIMLIQWNLLASIRKSLFICAYAQFRDYLTQNYRFYKLFPNHISSRTRQESQRIKHPSQDPYKRFHASANSRAEIERRRQQKEQMNRQILAKNKGQKIPSSHLYIILPQIYRAPTAQQQFEHEKKAAQKTQQILNKRGIDWVTVQMPVQKKEKEKQQQKKQKKSWFSL